MRTTAHALSYHGHFFAPRAECHPSSPDTKNIFNDERQNLRGLKNIMTENICRTFTERGQDYFDSSDTIDYLEHVPRRNPIYVPEGVYPLENSVPVL
jgi:hypothetical protein